MNAGCRQDLERIFRAGLQRVDPYRIIRDAIRLDGKDLVVELPDQSHSIDLSRIQEILVVGCGKATAPMARALEEILPHRLTRGIISVKYGHTENLKIIEILEAGHPTPDHCGLAAAQKIVALADGAGRDTLVIALISGGGSALLPMPYHDQGGYTLSLADKQATTDVLLGCGADIEEINCIRKHLSAIKGGRFLERIAPARCLCLILSDVVGDNLSSIASGPTCPDPTTYGDCLAIIEKYDIGRDIPTEVIKFLQCGARGMVPETLKPGAPVSSLADHFILGSNRVALAGAADQAVRLGYHPVLLTSSLTGEAREVARVLAAIALDCRRFHNLGVPPVCLLSGGEPVVTLRGDGKGGRNQELALAYLIELLKYPQYNQNICFLAAATDGNDGPTDGAGGFVDRELIDTAKQLRLDPAACLANNDAYHFFARSGGLLTTGPTNTNVCDLQISLIL